MAEFDDRDPLLDHEKKDDEDDDEHSDEEVNNPFERGGGASEPSESTPMTTMTRDYGKEGARPKTAETSFIEGETQGRQRWRNSQSMTKDAWNNLSILYPNAEDDELEASYFNDRIEVRMKKKRKTILSID